MTILKDREGVLLREALACHEQVYRELCDNWLVLEKKAQLMAVAAGAVLSVLVAMMTNQSALLNCVARIHPWLAMFLPAIVLVVFCVLLLSGQAIAIASVSLPPEGDRLVNEASVILMKDDGSRLEDFQIKILNWKVDRWRHVCGELYQANEKKAVKIRYSQNALIFVAFLALVFVFLYSAVLTQADCPSDRLPAVRASALQTSVL